MDLGLTGKKAIVTAASRGLGRAIAQGLAAEGVELVICARGEKSLRETEERIREAGGKIFATPADLSKEAEIKRFVVWAAEKLGAIDILVNNAGGPRPGKFEDMADEHWQDAFDLTFMSVQRLCREALPYMRKQGGGRIINLSSLSVRQPLEGLITSNSLRLGVVGLGKTLADEVARDNITVNTVCPGFCLTDRLKNYMASIGQREGRTVEEVMNSFAAKVPMGRLAAPENIADLVVFLASERANYMTGLCVPVDGGTSRAY